MVCLCLFPNSGFQASYLDAGPQTTFPACAVLKADAWLPQALQEGDSISDEIYTQAMQRRSDLQERMKQIFGKYDALACLPVRGEAPSSLDTTGDPCFCTLWTFLGLPAITIPTGLGPNGLPLGMQLVGRMRAEADLIETASWCENIIPFRESTVGGV